MTTNEVQLLADRIDKLRQEIAKQNTEIAVLTVKTEALEKKVSAYSGGVSKILWTAGGVIIASFVTWIIGGGIDAGK